MNGFILFLIIVGIIALGGIVDALILSKNARNHSPEDEDGYAD